MKHVLISIAISALAVSVIGPALAAGSPGAATGAQPGNHTPVALGQPNDTCGSPSAPFTPGESAFAPGSAFNPTGVAGSVYAGQQPQNSNNPASVAQYDVACAH